MAIDRWLAKLVSWFAHWLSRGLSGAQAMARAREVHPRLSPADLETGLDLGQRSVENVNRANRLEPTEPLAAVLGEQAPQGPTVDLRVTMEFQGPSGASQFRTVIGTFSWLADFGDVSEWAGQVADEIIREVGTDIERRSELVGFTISNPMMF